MQPWLEPRGGSMTSDMQAYEIRQFLTFDVARERFAIPIACIREIIEFNGATSVPMMPEFLRGVINLRGAVVPVVDLSARLGFGVAQAGRRSCVVILDVLQGEDMFCLGALVDAVNEVLSITPQSIEPKPGFGARIRADFIEGILNIDNAFVIGLDITQVMSIEQMSLLVGGATATAIKNT